MSNNVYCVPANYYFRIHHCRSRFKDDVESVLIFMASEISRLSDNNTYIDNDAFNEAIWHYPGNATLSKKSVDNWRTEISSLFGFVEYSDDNKKIAGNTARHLARYQDLTEFFKIFLYKFQYPGAHITSDSILEEIQYGVHFKPAQYILSLLKYAETNSGKREFITKAEACHCIFNDLRCTRDKESSENVWKRILNNRENEVSYDGDTIRYAGDILDYMVLANLLVCYDHKRYYSNYKRLKNVIDSFISSTEWFDGYDQLYQLVSKETDLTNDKTKKKYNNLINQQKQAWFRYVNKENSGIDFRTNLLSLFSQGSDEFIEEKRRNLYNFFTSLSEKSAIKTKETGDLGEDMIYIHECKRVKEANRGDIIHIIQPIPTKYAVGYDLQSVDATEKIKYKKRYIEVKTTITHSKIKDANYRFHITPNEISTAETVRDNYFVYRLMINSDESKLFVIQDPIGLYEKGLLNMIETTNGADISFDIKNDQIGSFEELLTWED